MKKSVLLVSLFLVSILLFGCGKKSTSSSYNDYYNNNYKYTYTTTRDYDYETPSIVLRISTGSVTTNSSYTVCTGTVSNTGKKTYKFVQVKGAFKDSSGNVLDTDWTYAAGSEGLAPGESSSFRLSVPKNSRISTCSVTLLDYRVD